MNVSTVILTFNERDNLPRCLESLEPVGGELFIVDSGSSDGTLEIAARHKANVLSHPFETHAKQWAWALDNLPLTSEWILALDADQRLTPELANEIRGLFSGQGMKLDSLDGLFLNRRQVWRGRWIRHGTYYPKYLLKLFRRGKVHFDPNDLLDHHFYISGATAHLRYDMIEENKKEDDITFWIQKHNHYSTLKAREERGFEVNGYHSPLNSSLWGNPDQRTLRLKEIWRSLPLFIRPSFYFFYRYFVRLGFLDGKEGFIFHFLHAFWFRLLVDIKLEEMRAAAPGPEQSQILNPAPERIKPNV